MYTSRKKFEYYQNSDIYHTHWKCIRQEKKRQLKKLPLFFQKRIFRLLLAEGHAVGALILCGIAFVGTDTDPVQRTVIFLLAVVCTLTDSAFNGLVGMAVHNDSLLWILDSELVCTARGNPCRKFVPILLFI